jgi:hypothetical protein
MSPAAISILNLCVTLLLLNSGSWAEQCRLAQHPNGVSDPSIPSGVSPPINSSTSPANTNSSRPIQPFAYGQDVVRGVNLYVGVAYSYEVLNKYIITVVDGLCWRYVDRMIRLILVYGIDDHSEALDHPERLPEHQ